MLEEKPEAAVFLDLHSASGPGGVNGEGSRGGQKAVEGREQPLDRLVAKG